MAITTTNQKLSLLHWGSVWESSLPLLPSTLGQDDRQQLLWSYPGVLWSAPLAAVEATFTGLDYQQILTYCELALSPTKSFARQGASMPDVIFRDGRVTKFGTVRRSLSDYSGAREQSVATIEFDDTDGVMTALNAATPFKGKELSYFRIDDASRRTAVKAGRVLFRGLMGTPQRSGFKLSVQVFDLLSYDAQIEIPRRRINPAIFDSLLVNGNKNAMNQIVPVIYGEHLGTTNEPWPIPVIPVDVEVINGVTFGRMLVSGNTNKEFVKVFRNGSNVTNNTRIYVPGLASWTGNANFTAAGFNTLLYRDLGPERYSIIYVHFGDWPKYRDGVWTLHVQVKGVEDSANGDGTGTLITSVHKQMKHWVTNYHVGNQKTTPVNVPTWSGGDAKVDTASFDTAHTAAVARSAEYTGASYIGQAYLPEDLLALWAVSGDVRTFITRAGAVAVKMFDKGQASSATWGEEGDVKAGTFRHETLDTEHANELQYRFGERYVLSGWKGDGASLRSNATIVTQGRKYTAPQPVELNFITTAAVALNNIDHKLRRRLVPPVRATLTTSFCEAHDRELGDVVSVRHTDPLWTPTARKVDIEALEVNFDDPDVVTTVQDHDQVPSTNPYAQTISTLTRSGKVATANTAAVHGYVTGDFGSVSGVTPAGYNGTWAFVLVDTDTVTYTMLSDPGASGSGTMLLESREIGAESGLPPPRKVPKRRTVAVTT